MSDRNEADTRAELIEPSLTQSGWGQVENSKVRREVIAPGRILPNGQNETGEFADFVLLHKNHKLAAIEAKREGLGPTEGVNQAKRYAERLQTRFAYSTNGHKIYEIDMSTGDERYIDAYPSPDELWARTYSDENIWRDRFAEVPFQDKGGTWEARYYQHNAIENVLESIAAERTRILLTMATGTGKTFIAFQIAWKLYQSRWTLKRDGKSRPNILFLADRNILADQAFNAFDSFDPDHLVRIAPDSIRKQGQVPTNGAIFFTIFQTFMSGTDSNGDPEPYFGHYPEDFFDFIIIDECHRGGANDESTWRGILDYFSPAVHLGLTATPKRTENVDTYEYFDKPVYEYSLRQGINDGYLTPFRVKKISSNLDTYKYDDDDDVIEGEIDPDREYTNTEINRSIMILEREQQRVELIMQSINQAQKTLIFCATQRHAAIIRDYVNALKENDDPNYCVRVTADDGHIGEQHLRLFQDNEKTIPTVITTSKKLSTGVDARNVRNIVILRPVNTMTEFKQIIGRGTRLFKNKGYFTIYDFEDAHGHFNDPEWDGDPDDCEICKKATCECVNPPTHCSQCGNYPCTCPRSSSPCSTCQQIPCICERPEMIIIQLGNAERTIHNVDTLFYSPDGAPMTAKEFIEHLFGQIPELFENEQQLREIWTKPSTRKNLLDRLTERGFGKAELSEIRRLINAEDSDIYDVLSYIAYETKPVTRSERAEYSKNVAFTNYTPDQQIFLDFVLSEYVAEGVGELDQHKLPDLLELKYGGLIDAETELGEMEEIKKVFVTFQQHLYPQELVS